jgi:hypothetical protein
MFLVAACGGGGKQFFEISKADLDAYLTFEGGLKKHIFSVLKLVY